MINALFGPSNVIINGKLRFQDNRHHRLDLVTCEPVLDAMASFFNIAKFLSNDLLRFMEWIMELLEITEKLVIAPTGISDSNTRPIRMQWRSFVGFGDLIQQSGPGHLRGAP